MLIVILFSFLFGSEVEKPVTEYNRIGFNYELNKTEKVYLDTFNINYVEGTTESLEEKYKNGELDLYVVKDNNTYELTGEDTTNTTYALWLVESYFDSYKEYLQSTYLTEKGIDPNEVQKIIVIKENLIEQTNFFKKFMISYGFIFIMMAITISSTYSATDATAGEKESGTLETLLTFPIKSKEIILSKFLCVTMSSFITGIISLVLLIVSLKITNNIK